jgi:hypothetical protein
MILIHRPGLGGNIPSGRTLVRRALRRKSGSASPAQRRYRRRKATRTFNSAMPMPTVLAVVPFQKYQGKASGGYRDATVSAVSETMVHATAYFYGPDGTIHGRQATFTREDFSRRFR